MAESFQPTPNGGVLPGDRARRYRMFRILTWASFGAFVSFLFVYIGAKIVEPAFPLGAIFNDIVAISITVVILLLLNPERLDMLAIFYMFSISTVMFVTMLFIQGVGSPYALALPLLSVIAGEVQGRRGAFFTVGFHVVGYLVLAILEGFDLISPFMVPDTLALVTWGAIFIIGSVIIVIINEQSMAAVRSALEAVQQRGQELARANQRAEDLAQTERLARERAQHRAQVLRETIGEYTAFLERVMGGDYSLRLDLAPLRVQEDVPPALIDLGQYLNRTVDTLTRALEEVQAAQRAYVQQSWEAFVEAGVVPSGYRYQAIAEAERGKDEAVRVDEAAWLPSIERAIRTKDLAFEGSELAVPIGREELIGALAVRRETEVDWSEDELALVTAVSDQLAQTLENLRLLEETSRRAARERKAGEVAASIRQEVEIEAVLERALTELGRALQAERGIAHLSLADQEEGA